MTQSLGYKIFRIVLLGLNAAMFAGSLGCNSLSMQDGLFNNASNQPYELDITPAPWTFGVVWATIYTVQAIIIVYSIVNIFRSTPDGGRLYYSPDIIPVAFLVPYMANWVCNSTWILIAVPGYKDNRLLPVMAVVLWLLAASLVTALFFSYRALYSVTPALIKFGLRKDLWLVRLLIHNGVSIYATWACIASCLNTALSLAYFHGVPQDIAGTVALGLVAGLTAAYVSLDTFLLDRWTRYVLAPHCTLVLALTGSLVRIGLGKGRNSYFVLVLLSVAAAATVLKVVLMVVRAKHQERRVTMEPEAEVEEDRYGSTTKLPLP